MVERVFPSNAAALKWATRLILQVVREVNTANVEGEKWIGCEPDSVYFDKEDFYNLRPLYIAYHTDRLDWANVIADAVRKTLEDWGCVIQSDYRQDYGDGSYEITIETERAKIEVIRDEY